MRQSPRNFMCPVQQNGLNPAGPIYKALDGQFSNLRWDIVGTDLQAGSHSLQLLADRIPVLQVHVLASSSTRLRICIA